MMTNTQLSFASRDSERGIAVIAILFALLTFSVLSLSVLRNPALEVMLRTSDAPDLHVVLYAGGAGSPEIIGRLNLPTVSRLQETVPDTSAEVRAPAPVGDAIKGEFQPGHGYTVLVAPGVRVCCDGGDGTCANVAWDEPVPEGSISPKLERPLETAKTNRELQFSLSAADIADNVTLDPDAATEAPFLIKAAKVHEANVAPVDGATVSCRLDTRETKLAEGTLQLQPGTDRNGHVNRISSGTVKLSYQAPRE
jgi:hypothetical protein